MNKISLLPGLLETVGYGAVITSSAGVIQAKNQAAERILHKMLRMPPTVPVPERLPRNFLAMLDASAPGPLSMGLPGMRPCVAQKVSLDVGSAVFLVICVDLNACGPVQTELLQSVFGLTRGEAQLARALSTGASLSEIAARTGVGIGTLRGQLKSIFLKTDTNRQAELAVILGQLGCLSIDGFSLHQDRRQ
jgi:DNA-binding CsgD family transcriptional regulator